VGYGGQRHRTVARAVAASSTVKTETDGSEAYLEPEIEPLKASLTTLPAEMAVEPSGGGNCMFGNSSVNVMSIAADSKQTNPVGDLTGRKMAVVSATRAEAKGMMKASTDFDEVP